MIILAFLTVCLSLIPALALPQSQVPLEGNANGTKKVVRLADIFSGNITDESRLFPWVSFGEDGDYLEANGTSGNLFIVNVASDRRQMVFNATDLKGNGSVRSPRDIQPSGKKILVLEQPSANYYIFDVEAKTYDSLIEDQNGDITWAKWSTVGDTIAFIRHNSLYIWKSGTPNATRITYNSSADASDAVNFSPDGQYLTYLRVNKTGVPTDQVPYYMDDNSVARPHPKYDPFPSPKAGEKIPVTTLHLLSLNELSAGARSINLSTFEQEGLLINEVAWVTDDHSHLVIRSLNREQDHEKLILYNVEDGSMAVVRERKEPHGWIDRGWEHDEGPKPILYVPHTGSFLDLSDESGWMHIYSQSVNGSDPLALTSGEWEVDYILHADSEAVYYSSTERDSTERHIYSVSLDSRKRTALVDTSKEGYWSASFSHGGGFYVLSYQGPGIPRQELYSIKDPKAPIRTLTNNSDFAEKLSGFALPHTTWTTIESSDGFSMNAMERLPPNFDPKKKYPLLLNPYGGPGSQQTQKTFRGITDQAYFASDPELEYVILVVDGRGTGNKGRNFRSIVTGQLGHYEALDQVTAASAWAKRPYIDSSKIVIWGWSYGGYLSAKVIELDTDVFSSAIITAPVSSWTLYGTHFESYMKSPAGEGNNYTRSAVHNVTGFCNVRGGVLIQHGTADDNVLFQHTAELVDLLVTGGVPKNDLQLEGQELDGQQLDEEQLNGGQFDEEWLDKEWPNRGTVRDLELTEAEQPVQPEVVSPSKLQVQFFTDSDHNINSRGGRQFLYRQIAWWLWKEKNRAEQDGDEGESAHQWDRPVV